MSFAFSGDDIYLDGVELYNASGFGSLALAGNKLHISIASDATDDLGSWVSKDGRMVINRTAGVDDADLKTHGPKLQFTFKTREGIFQISAWHFNAPSMPTEAVLNIRLALPRRLTWTHYRLDGVCFGCLYC